MKMGSTLRKFMISGKHLPSFLRDFHDQKDLFKTIHDFIVIADDNFMLKEINWSQGQCYVIDVFLWYMGMHGYTLQKSKAKQEFLDINANLEYFNNKREEDSNNFLKSILKEKREEGK